MEIKTTGQIWADLYEHTQINKELYFDLDKKWVSVKDLKIFLNECSIESQNLILNNLKGVTNGN